MLKLIKLAVCLLFGCDRFLVFAQGAEKSGDWYTVCRRCRRIS